MNNGNMPANSTNVTIDEYEGTFNCSVNKLMTGITKREYFAGLALQGMSSHPEFYSHNNEFAEDIAMNCVMFADALLKELDK